MSAFLRIFHTLYFFWATGIMNGQVSKEGGSAKIEGLAGASKSEKIFCPLFSIFTQPASKTLEICLFTESAHWADSV